jgi:hypothetical protein
MLVAVLVSGLAVACGGDDEPEATATTVTDAAAEGDDVPEATATSAEQEAPAVTAEPDATATDPIPTATASATPEGGLDPSLLVIPEARDASIPQNGRVLGDPDAAVSIVEYGDFQ